MHKQPGGLYKVEKDSSYWYLLHKMMDIVGDHREELNRVMTQETWRVVHRFDTHARQLGDFQERCDQYQTDPEVMLSVMPICLKKMEEGQAGNVMTGQMMTTVRFKENIEMRTNETELSNDELDKKLKDVFGINLEH